MAYWIASLALLAFGVISMLSIGRPFLLVGLTLLVLGPLRQRPAWFWPPLAAVVAWNMTFMAIAPWMCTATQTIGVSTASGSSNASTTVCSSLIGITYQGSGTYNPSLEPANQAAFVVGVITFVVVLIVISLRRVDRLATTA